MEVSKAVAAIGVESTPPSPQSAQNSGFFPQDHSGKEGDEDRGQATVPVPIDSHIRQHAFAEPQKLSPNGAAVLEFKPVAPEPILSSWVATDPASVHLLSQVRRAAASRSPLLICGEPGTGKDLLASLVHYLGPHPNEPLLHLDCTALPPDFLDIELFGAETTVGAGVTHVRRGRLEFAGAGTIVLREVGVLTVSTQSRLMAALADGRFHPMGGSRSVPMNARLIALTSTDLHRAVEQGTFREDLYFRFAVVPLVVPPLRQRPRDIRPLADLFLKQFATVHRKPQLTLSPSVVAALQTYGWPGNVGELRHLIELLVLAAACPTIEVDDLPAHVRGSHVATGANMSLEEVERTHIATVLEITSGKKSAAAKILGISRKTLLEKRKKYGLI